MTKEEILEICQKEMCIRLKKYDVVGTNIDTEKVEWEISQSKNTLKKEFTEHLKSAKHVKEKKYVRKIGLKEKEKYKNHYKKIYKTKKIIAVQKILVKIFSVDDAVKWELFYELSNARPRTVYNDERCPEKEDENFVNLKNDLQKYKSTALWLYQGDLLSAVAYHTSLSNFKLKENEIGNDVPYEKIQSLNIPVDLKIQINNIVFCMYPGIGGILKKKYFSGKLGKSKHVYLKQQQGFIPEKNFNKEAKGINYKIYKDLLTDISKKSLLEADKWVV